MNPLREVPLFLMPHLPDTLFGQGVAMAGGVSVCMFLIGGAAALGYWIANKMGIMV